MSASLDLVLTGGQVFTPGGLVEADLGIAEGKFAALGDLSMTKAADRWQVQGLTLLPGVIDTQVHFREPGLEQKEDLASGSAAAAMGGVTTFFEMPNTSPNTDSVGALADKLDRANGRVWVDHAFFVGATAENLEQLPDLEKQPGCCGVKIFMGSSTGNLLVADDATLLEALRRGERRVAVHAEDEERLRDRLALVRDGADVSMHPVWRDDETALRATQRLISLARQATRRVHVLHITTAEEIAFLAACKDIATVEVTPQHLTLTAPNCYQRHGSLAQMNPPIRDQRHQAALWRGIFEGVVDVIGSDHAPHTIEEKERPYPHSPSGMPGVQTLLPLMLNHVNNGQLSLARLVDLTSAGPQRIYNMMSKGRIACGYDADLTIVDLKAEREVSADWLASKCGWSPFLGEKVTGWPVGAVVRGKTVMRDGALLGKPEGRPVRFQECLRSSP